MKNIETFCKNCTQLFLADKREINRGNAKFCSLTCAAIFNNFNKDLIDNICKHCSQTFTAKSYAKYCSNSCKQKHYRLKSKSETSSIKQFYKLLNHLPCEICNFDKCKRHLHHIKYVSQGGKNELNNLISLCPNCHAMVHENLISKEALYNALKVRLYHHPELYQEQDAVSGN